jgi:hypothetical protein
LKKGLPEIVEIDAMTPENVRAAQIFRFGPQCAAWLCNRMRKQVRKYGAFSLHAKAGVEEPAWLEIALCYLRDYRARKWTVLKIVEEDGAVRYRVGWLFRKDRTIPLSITPFGRA